MHLGVLGHWECWEPWGYWEHREQWGHISIAALHSRQGGWDLTLRQTRGDAPHCNVALVMSSRALLPMSLVPSVGHHPAPSCCEVGGLGKHKGLVLPCARTKLGTPSMGCPAITPTCPPSRPLGKSCYPRTQAKVVTGETEQATRIPSCVPRASPAPWLRLSHHLPAGPRRCQARRSGARRGHFGLNIPSLGLILGPVMGWSEAASAAAPSTGERLRWRQMLAVRRCLSQRVFPYPSISFIHLQTHDFSSAAGSRWQGQMGGRGAHLQITQINMHKVIKHSAPTAI